MGLKFRTGQAVFGCMKEFSCGDVVPGCKSRFRGASENDIFEQVGKHAHEDHGLTEISEALVSAVRANIVEAKE